MSKNNINIAKPILSKEEEKLVLEVLRSGHLTQGEVVKKFEEDFAKFIGVKHAIATSNGTTALHLALLSLDLNKDDEVITTSFSFIASATTIIFTGAKPVFVDIDEKTFNIDPKKIEEKITKRTKAIMPVHLYGLPANMSEILKIAKKYKLKIIEDACQAHGAEIKRKKVGSLGDSSCFSFYPTKNMTTGEGGMITTNNDKLAEKIRLLREHGMKVRYYHDILGYNYRMTNLAAAIGIPQLKMLPKFNKKRQQNAQYYLKKLVNIKGIILPTIPKDLSHVFHQFTLRITNEYPLTREELIEKLNKHGVGSAIYYPIPIHQQTVMQNLKIKASLPITEKLSTEVLSIPVHPSLTRKDLDFVISLIKEM